MEILNVSELIHCNDPNLKLNEIDSLYPIIQLRVNKVSLIIHDHKISYFK